MHSRHKKCKKLAKNKNELYRFETHFKLEKYYYLSYSKKNMQNSSSTYSNN